ncbi:ABC transporter ATP-binding protein [Candidatus Pelagibacter sp. HIMB1495]|uniref:ABC transporter ATP-binding protein n=1 Tax=unclassified Candidatus Pelagibacter TaxID=2647897 RepID=UPI003F868B03
MSLLDMIGVASIMPFMTVLTNPTLIETNSILNILFKFFEKFGFQSNQEFLFVFGLMVFILLVFSISFKALTMYLLSRFTYMTEYTISKLLVESYMHQPYSWFLNRNSADLGKSILGEVGTIVSHGIRPMLELVANSVIVIALLTLLILVDTKIAFTVFFTFGCAYWIFYKLSRGFVKKIGENRFNSNQLRFISLSEAFGAVKEVKLSRLEKTYIKRFSDPALKMANYHSSFVLISQIPRYFIEILAFGGMMVILLYVMSKTGTFLDTIPIITLYALAGYRLMPALQRIYNSFSLLRYGRVAIETIFEDTRSLKPINENIDQNISPLSFNNKITLNNINYNYPQSSRTALKDINLTIPVKATVGFVGETGSGKTTTVDIILGLLECQKGTLEVDGVVVNKQNLKAWQKTIGYVPQNIYLVDDSISANIALGIDPKNINHEAVKQAAKIANLHDFIMNDLPHQYQTSTGERGIRLSGGQRQRIGIARALYHKPKVLILDEATSALDSVTEKTVMEAIDNIDKDITIIIISHRLSTVKKCDKIFLLEKGKLINEGTFQELIKNNRNFRASVEKI